MDADKLTDRVEACLNAQDDLCHALEALADSLPERLDTHLAVTLTREIVPTLRQAHLLEETMILPILMVTQPNLGPTLARLRAEHSEDVDHAGDLHDCMMTYVERRPGTSAGELGYMLRSLFVPLRRHVAFDRDYVLPLYRAACR